MCMVEKNNEEILGRLFLDISASLVVIYLHPNGEERVLYLSMSQVWGYLKISLDCNSRLCLDCGKRYTNQWSKTLSSKMPDVHHRHAVMVLPNRLRTVLNEYRNLRKIIMDSAIRALNDMLSHAPRKEVLAGAIVVLHPFDRDLGFNPHIHLLINEGRFDKSGDFIHNKIITTIWRASDI